MSPFVSRILALLLLMLAASPASAKNKIWIGKLDRIEVKQLKGKAPYIEVELVEDQTNGRFGKYELDKALEWSPFDGARTGARITLDGVFPGDRKNFRFGVQLGVLKGVSITTTGTSFRLPNLQTTQSGRKLEHTQIMVETTRPVLINTEVVKDLGGERVVLRLFIVPQETSKQPQNLSNRLEFSTAAFDQPSTKPLSAALSNREQRIIRESLRALEGRADDDYVTAIYPVQNADPNVLLTIGRNRASQIGRLDLNRDVADILVTDRASFVRNILETLIIVDRPPPQVCIVAQIIEVNRSSGSKIGVDFSYMNSRKGSGLSSGSFKSSGILGQGAILAGVYQNMGSGVLEHFAADLNLMVESGQAKVAAQPVLRVINNQRGTFSTGERIPVYLPTSGTRTERADRRRDQTQNERNPGAKVLDSGAPLVTKDRRDNDFRGDYEEDRQNYGFTTVRTGVNLTVTPGIRHGKQVFLTISASYNEVVGYTQPFGNPILSERRVDTRIRVRDGETIVLGGLYRETERSQVQGLPILSDIPIIGRLFSSQRKSKETYDIMFVLTTFVQED